MTKDEWYRQLFERLDNSKFRSSFHLKQKDIDYINEKGLDTIRQHAKDFIAKREAPAYIVNDGKQTPMRGLENMVNWDGKDKDLLALIKYIADEDKLEKVLENPQVIKTPVVRNGKQSTLGYQPDIWKGWN